MENKKGLLLVVSGPSGVGKDTLVKEYLKDNEGFLSISATTRKIRKNEVNGKDYYFLTKEEFENKIKENDFLEYAIYNDCYYGTPKSEIEEKLNNGEDVILVIEVQGGLQIKKQIKDSVLIFLLPPSLEELENRLRNRKSDSEEMINNRLKIALKEIEISNKYDYTIINGSINNAKEKLKLIIEEERKKRNN
jgi:guanylate kinase